MRDQNPSSNSVSPPAEDLDLGPIEARAAAATPGPWTLEWAEGATPLSVYSMHPDGDKVGPRARPVVGGDNEGMIVGTADAQFIAAARTDVPLLCAQLRRLRDERALLREVAEACDRARKCFCNLPTCDALDDVAVAYSKLDAYYAGARL